MAEVDLQGAAEALGDGAFSFDSLGLNTVFAFCDNGLAPAFSAGDCRLLHHVTQCFAGLLTMRIRQGGVDEEHQAGFTEFLGGG
ncbi:MAG: hypothetical protein BWK73_53825 [Thiothrix lacustris]|uniref:Uncharacterized protein n=1 Tax=Thiothrix lacustris TaxID=525917 RepID=A0A1Y1Q719_9GAMM|nr:MAG: hypothetical protein BWK73_53825 [Thiothrix lacustris]